MLKQNKKSGSAGFTLPEIIVAMSILIMVIVASTNLLVSIMRSNAENINSLVAFELAQEGIEGVRNIRDSNWLLGADFRGKIQDKFLVWGVALPESNAIQYFTLESKDPDSTCGEAQITGNNIQICAPWGLALLGNEQPKKDASSTLLYKEGESVKKFVHVRQNMDSIASPFHRYLKIESVPYKNETKLLKYRVTAVVNWKERERDKEVILTTELTDWKGGPL